MNVKNGSLPPFRNNREGKAVFREVLHAAGYPTGKNMTRCSESGRSMVEMLGTLALIGVLSVVGLLIYNVAMASLDANNILNEVNKRAHTCMTQISFMDRECSLAEYANQIGTYEVDVLSFPQNYFGIKVQGVPENICQQIKNKGFPNASQILPETCATTNDIIFIFDSELKGGTAGMPQKCTSATVQRDCTYKTAGNTCGSNGFCTCASGQTLTPTGCCATNKVVNGACCYAGITTDETTGEKLCCFDTNKCCPPESVWVNGVCKTCNGTSVFRQSSVNYCRACPNRARSQWVCKVGCAEPDQVLANGECHCPFERPIMPSSTTDGKCYTCAEGAQTLNNSNVPLGYTREQIVRLCNYRGGTGGYSHPCADGTVGLWTNDTYVVNGETQKAGTGGTCASCAYVSTAQLNSRARCESCGGTWQSSAPGTQDEWASGTCTNRQL